MTRLLIALIAVTAMALAAPGVGAAAGHRKPCHRPGTHTVASSRLARVFEKQNGSERRLYGCLRARDRKVWLANAFDDGYTASGGYDDVTLNGRFAAWSANQTDISCKAECPAGYQPNTYEVEVRDLRRPAGRSASVPSSPSVLLVSRRGALVWSGDGELHVLDGDGSRVVDSDGYDEGSIAIHGDELTWTDASGPQSAPLGRY